MTTLKKFAAKHRKRKQEKKDTLKSLKITINRGQKSQRSKQTHQIGLEANNAEKGHKLAMKKS